MKNLPVLAAAALAVLLAAAPAGAQYQAGHPSADKTADVAPNGGETRNVWMLGSTAPQWHPTVAVDWRMSAAGMIGKPVFDGHNKRIATVEDIILDRTGAAKLIVLKETSLRGFMGRLAAFEYGANIERRKNGDVVMPLSDEALGKASAFSSAPAGDISMKQMLAGELVDNNGKKMALIDNVTLRDGHAALVIASYKEAFKMGGDAVALDFDARNLVSAGNRVDLKLSDAQKREWEDLGSRKENR